MIAADFFTVSLVVLTVARDFFRCPREIEEQLDELELRELRASIDNDLARDHERTRGRRSSGELPRSARSRIELQWDRAACMTMHPGGVQPDRMSILRTPERPDDLEPQRLPDEDSLESSGLHDFSPVPRGVDRA